MVAARVEDSGVGGTNMAIGRSKGIEWEVRRQRARCSHIVVLFL